MSDDSNVIGSSIKMENLIKKNKISSDTATANKIVQKFLVVFFGLWETQN